MTNDLLSLDESRERILLCGQMGIGKTHALYALCDLVQLHKPDATCYVLDADRGMGRLRRDWPQVQNMEYRLARSWADVEDFMHEVEVKQKPGDWVMIDMINRFWEMAQALEVGAAHGVSPGQKMLEQRKALVEQSKLNAPGSLPQPDWVVIKRFHNDEFIDRISCGWDANLIATTGLDPVDTDRDDALLVSIFARFGYRPDGEKRNAHRFDTVMMIEKEGPNRKFTLVKDRGRQTVERKGFGHNLWDDYIEFLHEQKLRFDDLL